MGPFATDRSLAWLAAAWVSGSVLAGGLLGSEVRLEPVVGRWLSLLAGSLAAGVIATESQGRLRRGLTVLLPIAAFVAGLVASSGPASPSLGPAGTYRLEGRVVSVRHGEDHALNEVVLQSARELTRQHVRLTAGTRIRLLGGALTPGDRIRAVARLSPRPPLRNGPTAAAPPQTGLLTGSIDHPGQATVIAPSPWTALERLRSRIRAALRSTLSRRSAGLARALVLGDGSAVPERDRRFVRQAGLAHVLAVSGLHVTLVTGLLVALLRASMRLVPAFSARLDVARLASALGVPTSLAFAAFAGGAPSAWRAAVTASLACSLIAIGRRPKAIPTAAAAILVLGVSPFGRTASPAFLLSVIATAAILTAPGLASAGPSAWLASAASSTWRATVATAPVAYAWFGSVPVLGFVSNVALVPVVATVLVPLSLGHAVTATVTPPLGAITAAALELASLGFLGACETLASLSLGNDLPPPTVVQVAAVGLAATLALGSGHAPLRLVGIGACVLLWSGAELHLRRAERPGPGAMRVTFVDVGQGDAALLQLDGTVLAVDGGGLAPRRRDRARSDPAARAITRVLRARRLPAIDVAVITHPHPDHVGGIASLSNPFVPRELWATRQASVEMPRSPAAILERRLHRGLRRPKDLCRRGATSASVTIQVLWPCPGYDPGLGFNDNSIVFTLAHAGRRFLFTGDIEAAAEQALVARYGESLRADVLKAPHHGSRTSSSSAFLEAVRPRVVVVSAGLGNRFHHPDSEVVRRYRKHGARVFRTDRHGRIDVWSRNDHLQIETATGHSSRIE